MAHTHPVLARLTRLCRQILQALVLLLAGAAAIGAPDADTSKAEAEAQKQATDAFWVGDFAEMERLLAVAKQAGGSLDARYHRVRSVRNGFEAVFEGYEDSNDLYFAEVEALTLQWAQQNPRSALAHALHANSLIARGWAYRGGGVAKDVPPEAWADFKKYIQQAAQYLTVHADVALTEPLSFDYLLNIGKASSWKPDRSWTVAKEGLKLDPNFLSLYYRVLTATLPKWQGDTRAVDRFINDAVAHSKAARGTEMYARLYEAAADEHYGHALFEDSYADWPKMKRGYQDWLKREPTARTHNAFAYFACLAKDKTTFTEQLDAMNGAKPDLSTWGSNPSRTYETCKRWGVQG